jgi:plastocyanin
MWRGGVPFTEDFQMEVSHPAWRAPIHKGDRLRITGVYENRDHAWYTAMTHEGVYVDPQQPPVGRCSAYLINQPTPQGRWTRVRKKVRVTKWVKVRRHGRVQRVRKRVWRTKWVRRQLPGTPLNPVDGVQNRPWSKGHIDRICGEAFGALPCERPEPDRGQGIQTDTVTIADFLYLPGDRSLSGANGAPARVKRGTALRFVNADQSAGIRHSVTTCAWPCNGPYVGNYPLADGIWDSTTLGHDAVDGGNPNPLAETPKDLPAGKYSYFCRIHPWMRGAFEVVQ